MSKVLEDRLSRIRCWTDKTAKLPKTGAECFEWFDALSGDLSPENLCCDGELSRTQTQMKYRKLMREWRALEKIIGRKVSEDEVFKYSMKKYEERRIKKT